MIRKAVFKIVPRIPRFLWLLLKGLFEIVNSIRKAVGDKWFIMGLIILFFVMLFAWALSL
jgi:hypothetical protein